MTTRHIHIQARHSSAIIERILQTIRIRGFVINQLQIDLREGVYDIQLVLTQGARAENLGQQLNKLVDVINVRMLGEEVDAVDVAA